ncbi:hypothetical protein ACWFRB_16290 [Rhodococcus sp. NPDC055112]
MPVSTAMMSTPLIPTKIRVLLDAAVDVAALATISPPPPIPTAIAH